MRELGAVRTVSSLTGAGGVSLALAPAGLLCTLGLASPQFPATTRRASSVPRHAVGVIVCAFRVPSLFDFISVRTTVGAVDTSTTAAQLKQWADERAFVGPRHP